MANNTEMFNSQVRDDWFGAPLNDDERTIVVGFLTHYLSEAAVKGLSEDDLHFLVGVIRVPVDDEGTSTSLLHHKALKRLKGVVDEKVRRRLIAKATQRRRSTGVDLAI
jgi:hypothetical protein